MAFSAQNPLVHNSKTFVSFGPSANTRSKCIQGAIEVSNTQTDFEPETTEHSGVSLSDEEELVHTDSSEALDPYLALPNRRQLSSPDVRFQATENPGMSELNHATLSEIAFNEEGITELPPTILTKPHVQLPGDDSHNTRHGQVNGFSSQFTNSFFQPANVSLTQTRPNFQLTPTFSEPLIQLPAGTRSLGDVYSPQRVSNPDNQFRRPVSAQVSSVNRPFNQQRHETTVFYSESQGSRHRQFIPPNPDVFLQSPNQQSTMFIPLSHDPSPPSNGNLIIPNSQGHIAYFSPASRPLLNQHEIESFEVVQTPLSKQHEIDVKGGFGAVQTPLGHSMFNGNSPSFQLQGHNSQLHAPTINESHGRSYRPTSEKHVEFLNPILEQSVKSHDPNQHSSEPLINFETSSNYAAAGTTTFNQSPNQLPQKYLQSQAPITTSVSRPHVSKSSLFCPSPYDGTGKARDWLRSLTLWYSFNEIHDNTTKISTMALLLKGPAGTWLRSLNPEDSSDFERLSKLFIARWTIAERPWAEIAALWNLRQLSTQSASDYIANLLVQAEPHGLDKTSIFYIALNGLKPQTRQAVMIKGATDIDELLSAATLVEVSTEPEVAGNAEILKALADMRLEMTRIQTPSVLPVRGNKTVTFDLPFDRSTQHSQDDHNPVDFIRQNIGYSSTNTYLPDTNNNQVSSHSPPLQENANGFYGNAVHPSSQPSRITNDYPTYQRSYSNFQTRHMRQPTPAFSRMPTNANSHAFTPRFNAPRSSFVDNRSNSNRPPCRNCASWHPPRSCPAFGIHCGFCSKPHHISRCCRSRFNASQ